jgi:methionyl-tRNA synthetase
MSKSLGNIVEPGALADPFGVDPLRYFLLRAIQFGQDGEWSAEAIGRRINADLANDLGNLAQRTLSMIARSCHGLVPQPRPAGEAEAALHQVMAGLPDACRAAHAAVRPDQALDAIWEGVAAANLYLNETAPWALRKTDPARADSVLYEAADAVRQLAILVQPAMPESGARLLDQLGIAADARGLAAYDRRLVPGAPLPAPQGVFPRWTAAEQQ